MKRVLLFLILISLAYGDLSVSQIHDMVIKIHEKREGIDLETLENTKEPFVRLVMEDNVSTFAKPKKLKDIQLNLHALLNKKAFINGRWYKVGDLVSGYKLKFIGKKGVVLRNENKIKKLFLYTKREQFIILDEKD